MSHWSNLFHAQRHRAVLKEKNTHTQRRPRLTHTCTLRALSPSLRRMFLSLQKKRRYKVGGAQRCLPPNGHPVFYFSIFFLTLDRFFFWMAADAVYIRMLDPFLHVYKVFTGVFKLCVWVLPTRPRTFTCHSSTLTKKNKSKKLCDHHALFQTFSSSKKTFNKTASAMTNHSLMSLWGTHTDFYLIFFFFCSCASNCSMEMRGAAARP